MNSIQMNGNRKKYPRRYITGLDGIRALAVLGVIIFHLLPYDIKGGYLGVAIFFVVSGYLITDLLLKEWREHQSINLKSFYFRRIRRLYPALVTMIFTTGAYITLFERDMLQHLWSITWTNLLYVYNWWEIGHGQNYFDRFQGESPFTHLWSLSIEGQFYLFWPIILVLFIIVLKNYNSIFTILLSLSLVSALWMSYLYHIGATTNRIYYGTDTRLFSITLGVALAFVWPSDHLKQRLLILPRIVLDLLGMISLVTIVFIMFNLSGQDAFTYDGGMLLISLATVFLVASCVHPGADINRLLTNPVFKWIGTRSYGIYLYQFPVMIFYESRVTTIGQYPLLNAGIELFLIGLISEVSYRLIETPLRHYDYRYLMTDVKGFIRTPWKKPRLNLILGGISLVVICWGAGIFISRHSTNDNQLQAAIQSNQSEIKKRNAKTLKKQREKVKIKPSRKLTSKEKLIKQKYGLTKQQVLTANHLSVTAIGDSIMADGSVDIQQIFPNAYISAAVGRQIWQAGDVIKQLKQQNELAPNVLINLGTNSPMTTQQINEVIRMIGKKRTIYWINCHVPTRYWEKSVNQTISTAAEQHKNVHVIDWYGESLNHPEYFWDDHIHPNPTGNIQYASLIARTVTEKV